MKKRYDLSELQDIVRRLRSENGCPWDKVQTHQSLERNMIEEAYETVEGIHLLTETGDAENLCEELGDVLLQVVFHSQIGEEEGLFTLQDVIQGVSEKMVHRHPHVFRDVHAENGEQIQKSWEELKKEEAEGKRDQRNELEKVPAAFPSLIRACKVQKKIEKGSYRPEESMEKIRAIAEKKLKCLTEDQEMDQKEAGDAVGDLLYQICKIAGRYHVDPEEELHKKICEEINSILGRQI